MDNKKRRVLSFENMDMALKEAFDEKYPKGYSDYLADLVKYDKPDGTSFYAVTVETDDCIALVKVQVKVDAAEDVESWLDSDSGDDDEGGEQDGDNLPDENISQYSNGDDDQADQD